MKSVISVKEAQTILKAQGFDIGKTGADGKAGPAFKKAITAFQIAKGLAPDGKLGPLTSDALKPVVLQTKPDAGLPEFKPSPEIITPGHPEWPLQKDCMKFYGGVGLNQVMLQLPFAMRLAWAKDTVVKRISIHEKCHDSAARAFQKIASAYDEDARKKLGLDLFGGSLNVRKMRGGSSYSMHSWGIAIDFDPERNQLTWGKAKARLGKADAVEFWKIWESEGWISLGRAADRDWMHVQAARLK